MLLGIDDDRRQDVLVERELAVAGITDEQQPTLDQERLVSGSVPRRRHGDDRAVAEQVDATVDLLDLLAGVEVRRVVDAEFGHDRILGRGPLRGLHHDPGLGHLGQPTAVVEVEVAEHRPVDRGGIDAEPGQASAEQALLREVDVVHGLDRTEP